VDEPVAPEGGWQEVNPETIRHFNLPSQRRAGCPGGGAFASAGSLALFYQVLVNGGGADGRPVLKPETIALATRVRTDPQLHRDALNDIPVNRGLTVVVAGGDGNAALRGFGAGASARAFGHGGGGQIAWGDPESGLSLGFVTNGFQRDEAIRQRSREISTVASACAG
jgi:CubicO group peptidase (beta-lactamase class C family)